MHELFDQRRYLIPFRSQLLPHVFTDVLVIGGGGWDAGSVENGPETSDEAPSSKNLEVKNPETGLIYLYDPQTNELSGYDPATHVQRAVTDKEEQAKAMRLFGRGG